MPLWAEITVTVFLVIAGVFGLVGSYGLVRLPDPMTRLHAPTKATTLGVGGVLIASMIYFFAAEGRISAHELLIAIFLFLTSPITALFIAKVHLHLREKPENLPTPREAAGWASYTASGPARGVRDFPPQDEPASPVADTSH
ncbi:MAG: Na+/H+ antiporter subunit G [Rhodobacter sp.]|nr:Na+/H+ antiporter subunit G [Paracoccaceae bacterium]MCC0075031.1 Na+/H+ antiporter subunit G [Rhodobacter sp.]